MGIWNFIQGKKNYKLILGGHMARLQIVKTRVILLYILNINDILYILDKVDIVVKLQSDS